MNRNEKGHIETIACGKGCAHAMECLGIEEDMEITFIKALPHMDYLALINRQERTRLSEGEAARIWGKNENEESTQFYFAKRNTPFWWRQSSAATRFRNTSSPTEFGWGVTCSLNPLSRPENSINRDWNR